MVYTSCTTDITKVNVRYFQLLICENKELYVTMVGTYRAIRILKDRLAHLLSSRRVLKY